MSYISIDILCEGCDHKWSDLVERERQEEYFMCPECGCIIGKKTLSAPSVMRASYPDNVKRKGWSNMKETARLECEAANLPHDKRSDHKKAIRELKGEKS